MALLFLFGLGGFIIPGPAKEVMSVKEDIDIHKSDSPERIHHANEKLSDRQLQTLMRQVGLNFKIDDLREFAIEA